MNRQQVAGEIRRAARLRGTFTLRSGKLSDTYFDKYQFESDPVLLRGICELMRALVPDSTDVLCGLELGGIPIVTVLSQLTGIPAAFIRKAPKTYGTCKYAEGPPLHGKEILLVEDVVSSGGQIIDTARMLRDDGIAVNRAICVIDRRADGPDALAGAGIALDAVFTMQEIEDAR